MVKQGNLPQNCPSYAFLSASLMYIAIDSNENKTDGITQCSLLKQSIKVDKKITRSFQVITVWESNKIYQKVEILSFYNSNELVDESSVVQFINAWLQLYSTIIFLWLFTNIQYARILWLFSCTAPSYFYDRLHLYTTLLFYTTVYGLQYARILRLFTVIQYAIIVL